MKKKITDFFNGMTKLEVSEYLTLLALATVSVWSWSLAVKIFLLLIVIAVVRIIATKHIGNPTLTKPMRWALYLMAGYYIWNVVTMLWTTDLDEGWSYLTHRLPLLVFPVLLLCADTSYITPQRRRGILHIVTLSMIIQFAVVIIRCFVTGQKLRFGVNIGFIHHTYTSFYIIMLLGFLYGEWFFLRNKINFKSLAGIFLTAAILILYMLFSSSRTGIAGLAFLFVFIVMHQLIRLRNIKVGLAILFCGLALGATAYFMLPENARRITKTFKDIKKTEKGDVRVDIYKCAFLAGIDNLPFGAGVGDGQATLEQYYSSHGHEWPGLNTHNIYLDSLLSLGIPGVLLLLAMLVLPAYDGYHRRDFDLMSLIFAVALSGLFESILSRQMGLMFIVPLWYVIASSEPCLQTDSTDNQ